MKKVLLSLILVMALLLSSCTQTMTDEQKDRVIMEAYTKGDAEKAKQKAVELYKDNENKALAWIVVFNQTQTQTQTESEDYINKLEIQEDWVWEIDGNYSYVKGRVKNTGNKNIRYFEVTAEYLDSAGRVLDSDYTNSGETLRVGNMKEFEIMHQDSNDYKEVRIFVNEVRIE
jgi:hypothetical protein